MFELSKTAVELKLEKLENELKALRGIVDSREEKIACFEGKYEWELGYNLATGAILHNTFDKNNPYIRCKHCYLKKQRRLVKKSKLVNTNQRYYLCLPEDLLIIHKSWQMISAPNCPLAIP